MATLQQLRENVEKIDHAIIKKLAARQKLSAQIGAAKAKIGKPVIDLTREKKLQQFYETLSAHYQLDANWIKRLFKLVVMHSRKYQKQQLAKKPTGTKK